MMVQCFEVMYQTLARVFRSYFQTTRTEVEKRGAAQSFNESYKSVSISK